MAGVGEGPAAKKYKAMLVAEAAAKARKSVPKAAAKVEMKKLGFMQRLQAGNKAKVDARIERGVSGRKK